MPLADRMLLSGDEAVAFAAWDAGIALGTGYPGTPSTEILEAFSALGGRAQWAPNEKVALEVALGAAFAGAPALCTMKHVGVNVAADPLFTAAYTGVTGPLVLVSADDPGMASSQNEQDNRRFALAAAVPMLEPADSQEAYDFIFSALDLSAQFHLPVLFRMTTRVCHSKSIVRRCPEAQRRKHTPQAFQRDIPGRVMIPVYARAAHAKLRQKLAELTKVSDQSPLNRIIEPEYQHVQKPRSTRVLPGAIITSGCTYLHVREAAPDAVILKLGLTYPLPIEKIRSFVETFPHRAMVIEEGDPYLTEQIRAAGISVEAKPDMYRFGELNVNRVRRILANDTSPEAPPPEEKPPQLCVSCPYHTVYQTFKDLDLIVAGDIGCYTLGVLPPYTAVDAVVCMGASLGIGLGLRHALPEKDARRVVSIIGDSTFVHSGITGLVEMAYNPPPTGHVVVILDNGTTAMTGMQEHPATGRTLAHQPTNKLKLEDLARTLGIPNVHVLDAYTDPGHFKELLIHALASNALTVIIARRTCLLAAGKITKYEQAAAVAGGRPCPQTSPH